MGKNILVMTGSPRVGGNSDLLADAFIKGATECGHEIVRRDVGRINILGCTACDTCFSTGSPCTFCDEFNALAPHIERADAIVFATPLYWFSFPAQIKAVIDKMYSFLIGNKKLNIKESMLLVCGEDPNDAAFQGIIASYKLIAAYHNWVDKGHLTVPGVLNKGDINATNALSLAEDMGTKF